MRMAVVVVVAAVMVAAARRAEATIAVLPSKHCFGEIGCFVINSDFFHPLYRPYNFLPFTREQVGVHYRVFSREDERGKAVQGTDVAKILDTSFKAARKTKMLIHGYFDDRGETWMPSQVSALLKHDDYNVLTVDWGGGSHALYVKAIANARVAGLEVAFLINWLQQHAGLQPGDVHLIGHSLGAHVAGYAGERVAGLGRITALDPAKPHFQGLPPAVRIDPSDAVFVDAIHTSVIPGTLLGFGMRDPVGHLDFYPNGGLTQPGCRSPLTEAFTLLGQGFDILHGLTPEQKTALKCSHSRSALLFTASLKQCTFEAQRCDSYSHFQTGRCLGCSKGCANMGITAEPFPGESLVQLFLTTAGSPSFC